MTDHTYTRSEVITALEGALLSTHTQQTILKALDPTPAPEPALKQYNPPVGSVYAWVTVEGMTLYAQCHRKSLDGYVASVRPLTRHEVPVMEKLITAVNLIACVKPEEMQSKGIATEVLLAIDGMYQAEE